MKKAEAGSYLYGFNNQEKDNEVAGTGNHYTALFWEMDPRTGRRWNLDPVDQISISNYAVNRLNPIWYNDPLGNDPIGKQKNGHEVGMPGSETTADLPDVEIKSTLPDRIRSERNGEMNIMQAARKDVGRNDAGRAKADMSEQAVGAWLAVGGAAVSAPILISTAPIWGPAVGPRIPAMGSYLMRARLASAASDVVAQGVNKGAKNINFMQTLSAFSIGNPFVSTLPGSFVDLSYSSLIEKNKSIIYVGTAKSIALSTAGNMLGASGAGAARVGMRELGQRATLFQQFLGQQVGHEPATYVDEQTNK